MTLSGHPVIGASFPKVRVRTAGLSDFEALAALFPEFFAEDGISVDPEAIRTNLHRMLQDDRACIFVAEAGANIVGMASGILTFGVEFGCSAEVEDLYVVPSFRGRGLAKALLNCVLDWADSRGAAEIILVVTEEAERNQGLTGFYEGFGFKDAKRITMYRGRASLHADKRQE
ncbi:GNAT family N-acetyltransferase [Alloyangia pacifica]|uniref:GNAT family N-acetyltransferase n=1 Tax=Alloyangia pacifica TaxID=311180 RepID=UPI001CD54467|nr:GNAT family N-acetyltransferase [Alloyangia pacifica]MCA0996616.1 GNAT family N-acetyltransferase [Alloyangia pacifica]